MLCFIFAYWLNHTFLAIVTAALIVWFETILIQQKSFFLLILQNPYLTEAEPVYTFWSILSFILSFIGALIALSLISKRIERQQRVRWIPGVVASVILLAGSFLLLIDLVGTSYSAQKRLKPTNYYLLWVNEFFNPFSAPAQSRGAYFLSITGSIVHVRPEGRQVLREVPLDLIPKPRESDLVSMYEDPNSREFWVIIRKNESDEKAYGIWKARPGEKLQLYNQFYSKDVTPLKLVKCGNQFCVYGRSKDKVAYAVIGENGLSQWQPITDKNTQSLFVGKIRDHLLGAEIRTGKVASLSADKRSVSRQVPDGTVQQWLLPGEADLPSFMGSTITPAFYRDGQPYFVLPVNEGNKTSLFVCNTDGSVAPLWNKSWSIEQRLRWESVPGGGYGWVLREAKTWRPIEAYVFGKDGTPYGPLPIQTTTDYANFVDFLKMEKTTLWLLTAQRFSKIDLSSGKTLQQFELPEEKVEYYENVYRTRTKEGVYFVRDDRICLIDWDGNIRDLGPASLN